MRCFFFRPLKLHLGEDRRGRLGLGRLNGRHRSDRLGDLWLCRGFRSWFHIQTGQPIGNFLGASRSNCFREGLWAFRTAGRDSGAFIQASKPGWQLRLPAFIGLGRHIFYECGCNRLFVTRLRAGLEFARGRWCFARNSWLNCLGRRRWRRFRLAGP